VIPPVRTQYGEAEQVAQAYAENSFDLVHSTRSLNNAYDPVKAIEAAVHVVRPGGFVYLAHMLNDGGGKGYGGPHPWNFGVEAGSFTITSKSGQRTDMTKALAGLACVMHSVRNGMLFVRIQKNQPGP